MSSSVEYLAWSSSPSVVKILDTPVVLLKTYLNYCEMLTCNHTYSGMNSLNFVTWVKGITLVIILIIKKQAT